MIAGYHTHNRKYQMYTGVMMLSAWSFVMVIASLLFLWAGYKLDELLGTAPIFMMSLFLMSFVACWTKLYQEAKKFIKEV